MFPVHIPSSILHGEVVGTGSFWPTFIGGDGSCIIPSWVRGGDGSCIIPSSVISVTISLNPLLHIQGRDKCFCLFVCLSFGGGRGLWVSICHLAIKRIQCNSCKGFLWNFFIKVWLGKNNSEIYLHIWTCQNIVGFLNFVHFPVCSVAKFG